MLLEIKIATDNDILGHFLPFTTLTTQKDKILKKTKQKSTWRYYPLKNTYYKSRSYDVWFLKYKVQQT